MKILHLTTALTGGGIKTFICSVSNEMVRQGHDVTICSIYKPKDAEYAYSWLDKRIKINDLGKEKEGISIKSLLSIARFVKNNDYDVVNIHGFFYYYALAILLFHNKASFFYTVHSDANRENTKWDKMILFIKRLFFRLEWIHPITISKESQRSFYSLYRCPSTMIYNGTPRPSFTPKKDILDRYQISPATRIFVHVGRISEPKNQVVLCNVFQRLINEKYDIVLLIIGQKHDNTIYNALTPLFSSRIQYLGEREDAIQYMSGAEAMCLPSIWEGMPITVIEALSVGCITVASPVGGIPEMIEQDVNGILSKDSSEEAYYSAMKHFLNLDREKLNEMRKCCLETFEQFNITHTASNYLEAYKQIKSQLAQ